MGQEPARTAAQAETVAPIMHLDMDACQRRAPKTPLCVAKPIIVVTPCSAGRSLPYEARAHGCAWHAATRPEPFSPNRHCPAAAWRLPALLPVPSWQS